MIHNLVRRSLRTLEDSIAAGKGKDAIELFVYFGHNKNDKQSIYRNRYNKIIKIESFTTLYRGKQF